MSRQVMITDDACHWFGDIVVYVMLLTQSRCSDLMQDFVLHEKVCGTKVLALFRRRAPVNGSVVCCW